MSYFDDYAAEYADLFEPSEADEIFEELKEKLVNSAKDSIKKELEQLRTENARLRKSNSDIQGELFNAKNKLSNLEQKEKSLRNEVKKEFYANELEPIFDDLFNHTEVWYAKHIGHERPKCNLCDDDRYMIATFPDGSTQMKRCSCANLDYFYEPCTSQCYTARFYKTKVSPEKIARANPHFYIKEFHEPNKEWVDAYDNYATFYIPRVFEVFDDEVINFHNKEIRCSDHIAFTSREECLKYCEWLNKEKEKKCSRL